MPRLVHADHRRVDQAAHVGFREELAPVSEEHPAWSEAQWPSAEVQCKKKKKIKDLTVLTVDAPELPVVFDSDAEVSSLGVAHL